MNNNKLLNSSQAADILNISEYTLFTLATIGQIPYIKNCANSILTYDNMQFCIEDIFIWLNNKPNLNLIDNTSIKMLKTKVELKYHDELEKLKKYDKQFIPPRKARGYSLHKVVNKKYGFIWYVRYLEKGIKIPTRWSTHTNNREAAEIFAENNREKLVSEYYKRKKQEDYSGNVCGLMKQFYKKDSVYLKKSMQRGRSITESTRRQYHATLKKYWIPFLQRQKITTLGEIDTPVLARFQDYCLDKSVKPNTVNQYMKFVSSTMNDLVTMGHIKQNPCCGLNALKVNEEDLNIRGCYYVNEMQGVFTRYWKDEEAYLLCLLIYSTGMRNSEISRIQLKDIIKLNNCHFIRIIKSKTRYGARLVPLHDFAYRKIKSYIKKFKKNPEDLLFCQDNGRPLPRKYFTNANQLLGKFTKYSPEKLKQENITFYSGRHFFKTLMNAYELGEVEEYFMGHKVSGDVAKRYNHRDRQGQEKIIGKAKEVFKILEKGLFTQTKKNHIKTR